MRLAIETDRLILKPFADEDAPPLARIAGDFEVARMTARIPHPYPVAVAEGWILTLYHRRRRGAEHAFAVHAKGGPLLGSISAFRPKRDAAWEVGYMFGKPYWGQGYASEALNGLIGWAEDDLGATTLTAGHFEDNPASGRVLAKAGFVLTGGFCPMYSLARGVRVRSISMARGAAAA